MVNGKVLSYDLCKQTSICDALNVPILVVVGLLVGRGVGGHQRQWVGPIHSDELHNRVSSNWYRHRIFKAKIFSLFRMQWVDSKMKLRPAPVFVTVTMIFLYCNNRVKYKGPFPTGCPRKKSPLKFIYNFLSNFLTPGFPPAPWLASFRWGKRVRRREEIQVWGNFRENHKGILKETFFWDTL